jgi:hypothetical protein
MHVVTIFFPSSELTIEFFHDSFEASSNFEVSSSHTIDGHTWPINCSQTYERKASVGAVGGVATGNGMYVARGWVRSK